MKTYIHPEIAMTSIIDEDILTVSGGLSNGGENGIAEDACYSQFFPGLEG